RRLAPQLEEQRLYELEALPFNARRCRSWQLIAKATRERARHHESHILLQEIENHRLPASAPAIGHALLLAALEGALRTRGPLHGAALPTRARDVGLSGSGSLAKSSMIRSVVMGLDKIPVTRLRFGSPTGISRAHPVSI